MAHQVFISSKQCKINTFWCRENHGREIVGKGYIIVCGLQIHFALIAPDFDWKPDWPTTMRGRGVRNLGFRES